MTHPLRFFPLFSPPVRVQSLAVVCTALLVSGCLLGVPVEAESLTYGTRVVYEMSSGFFPEVVEIEITFIKGDPVRADLSRVAAYGVQIHQTGAQPLIYSFSRDGFGFLSAFAPEATLRGMLSNHRYFPPPLVDILGVQPEGLLSFLPLIHGHWTGAVEGLTIERIEPNEFRVSRGNSVAKIVFDGGRFPARIHFQADSSDPGEILYRRIAETEGNGDRLTLGKGTLAPMGSFMGSSTYHEIRTLTGGTLIVPPAFGPHRDFNISDAFSPVLLQPELLGMTASNKAVLLVDIHQVVRPQMGHAGQPLEAHWIFTFTPLPVPAGTPVGAEPFSIYEVSTALGSFYLRGVPGSSGFFSNGGIEDAPVQTFLDLHVALDTFRSHHPGIRPSRVSWYGTGLSSDSSVAMDMHLMIGACEASPAHLMVFDPQTGLLRLMTGPDGGSCDWTSYAPWER
jgi:hypothetical protein